MMHTVFVYGTLMSHSLATYLIGRSPDFQEETLQGFKRVGLNILEDPTASVDGITFQVTDQELRSLDHYEGVQINLYKRIKVTLDSGIEAIAYQKVDPNTVLSIE